ncbi:hypothetical protein GCM10010149_88330 [Nonomuraea roseoviolacea subsp. roseoviolacea]
MKRRKVTQFYSIDGREIVNADCPKYIALTRRLRPDLQERPAFVYGSQQWRCFEGCHTHGV